MTNMKEYKCKNIEEIINYINFFKTRKERKGVKLQLSGNEIDVCVLKNKYQLTPSKWTEMIHKKSYGYFKNCFSLSFKVERNTYLIGQKSKYNQSLVKMNINDLSVEVSINPKTKKDDSFISNKVDAITNQSDYVVLDIETTGLDFIEDDIIQICLFDSKEKVFNKYLPLTKKQENTAYKYNHIKKQTLKGKKHLTQNDIDKLIEEFNLKEKVICFWSGANQFDRVFLEIYFKEHNLQGLESLTFCNAKNLLNPLKNSLPIKSLAKGDLALMYGIDCSNEHNALDDCIIEKQLINEILSGNFNPLYNQIRICELYKKYKSLLLNVKSINYYNAFYELEELYDSLCKEYNIINGRVNQDYDCPNKRTRGKEWIDIHHIDEIELDDIAVRTQVAIENDDEKMLKNLKKYNVKERLVYVNKVEHFLLHILITLLRRIDSGGPHWLFGSIVQVYIGEFKDNDYRKSIQTKLSSYLVGFSIDDIIFLYSLILYKFKSDLKENINFFWKLETYQYNQTKLDEVISKINSNLNIFKEV